MRMPQGFRFAGLNSGVKAQRKDLALFHESFEAFVHVGHGPKVAEVDRV